jgi:hypothetical protein
MFQLKIKTLQAQQLALLACALGGQPAASTAFVRADLHMKSTDWPLMPKSTASAFGMTAHLRNFIKK